MNAKREDLSLLRNQWPVILLSLCLFLPSAQGQETTSPQFRPPDVQIVKSGRETVIVLSGVGPFDNKGQLVAPGDFTGQLRQALENVRRIAAGAGSQPGNIVSMTVYTADKQGAEIFYKLQQENFKNWHPATTFVESKHLRTDGALVEIHAVAVREERKTRR